MSAFEYIQYILNPNEQVTHIVFGEWLDLDKHTCPPKYQGADFPHHRLLTLEQALPWMEDWSFDNCCECFSLFAWTTEDRIIFVSEYDGSCTLNTIPCHPLYCMPRVFGSNCIRLKPFKPGDHLPTDQDEEKNHFTIDQILESTGGEMLVNREPNRDAYKELVDAVKKNNPDEDLLFVVLGNFMDLGVYSMYTNFGLRRPRIMDGEFKTSIVPNHIKGKLLPPDNAKSYMKGWSLYPDYHDRGSYAMYAWSNERVFWLATCDGRTSMWSAPRQPRDTRVTTAWGA